MEDQEKAKLEWMYKGGSNSIDREEYLLGRAVDKAFERSEYGSMGPNEIEKDCLPQSIFSNAGSDVQVDIFRKKQEDPLEAIRQKEIELRKQLLKNPIKLRKLQNMLKEQSRLKKKAKKKKKKHSEKSSSENEEDLDKMLASKYLKLVKKYGLEKLKKLNAENSSESESAGSGKEEKKSYSEKTTINYDIKPSTSLKVREKEYDERKRKNERNGSKNYKKKFKESKKSMDSSDSPSDDEIMNKHQKRRNIERMKSKSGRKRRDSSSSDSCSQSEKKKFESIKTIPDSIDKRKSKVMKEPDVDHKSRKHYGLLVPFNAPQKKRESEHRVERSAKGEAKVCKQPPKNKLSDEEKERRRKEMMENAKWRDEVRLANVKKYRKEEEEEKKKEKGYDSEFLRRHMSNVMSIHGSVEDRIRSNINSIQRTSVALDKNFTKR